uniref:Tripartite motif containing 52 n=1 Tax=Loxodonta africana TaxID=9785 RepID=G3T844_LOXAF
MASCATTNPAETLQEDAVCAICLDYFKDSITIGCGHNFSRGRVTQLYVGATGGRDNSIREVLYRGNADEGFQDEDKPWVGDGGIRNWDSMDYVWDQEEDRDCYLDGLRHDLRIDVYPEKQEIFEEYDEDEELYSDSHLPPPPTPQHQFTSPQCLKNFTRPFPNLQLANMVQIIHQMCPMPYQGSRGNDQGCSKHQEALKLFCEVDKEVICVVCQESWSHKQHNVVPLESYIRYYHHPPFYSNYIGKKKIEQGNIQSKAYNK